MWSYPNSHIAESLIINTPIEYPLYKNEKEALVYLQLLTDKDFLYKNHLNYDAINYENLIYIEEEFGQYEEINTLLQKIKRDIADNYIYKQKYLKRLKNNIIDLDKERREQNISEINLPPYWLNEFRIDVEEEYK